MTGPLPLEVTFTTETVPYDITSGPLYRDENGYPIPPLANAFWFADGSIAADPLNSQTPVIL